MECAGVTFVGVGTYMCGDRLSFLRAEVPLPHVRPGVTRRTAAWLSRYRRPCDQLLPPPDTCA